jgi:hypothetical protein
LIRRGSRLALAGDRPGTEPAFLNSGPWRRAETHLWGVLFACRSGVLFACRLTCMDRRGLSEFLRWWRLPGAKEPPAEPEAHTRPTLRRTTENCTIAAGGSRFRNRLERDADPRALRNRWFADSPLEGDGFELVVPRCVVGGRLADAIAESAASLEQQQRRPYQTPKLATIFVAIKTVRLALSTSAAAAFGSNRAARSPRSWRCWCRASPRIPVPRSAGADAAAPRRHRAVQVRRVQTQRINCRLRREGC